MRSVAMRPGTITLTVTPSAATSRARVFDQPCSAARRNSAGVVLAHLLLGRNVFKGPTAEESRNRVMKLAIPDFRKLDSRIDDRLQKILQRALARDLQQRYATADELGLRLLRLVRRWALVR